ncbi:MAG: hypothetical protein ACYCO9_00655 [Streptosporangiaceae bacterium]
MTENEPVRPPAPGASGAGNAVARRGDLVVICLRHRDWKDGQSREYDDFWLGQVTSVTRAGLVRLYRPAGSFAWDTDGRGRPDRGQPLPSLWFERAAIKSQKEIDVPGALATAACHVWPGHEGHVRGYGTLAEVKAALRPHLPESPWREQLRDAAAAWEAAWREARPLLSAAVRAHGEEFRRLSDLYDAAVTAANSAYRELHGQAAGAGSAAA